MDISVIVTQDTLVLTVMRMSMSACHILAFTGRVLIKLMITNVYVKLATLEKTVT